jgi:hypothetical protein
MRRDLAVFRAYMKTTACLPNGSCASEQARPPTLTARLRRRSISSFIEILLTARKAGYMVLP